MFQQLGLKIRTVREQKGIGLNQLAKELGVSSGYLSNLERGKTETVPLSFLEKLDEQLHFSTLIQEAKDFKSEQYDEMIFRIDRCSRLLKDLNNTNPELANCFVSMLEKGLDCTDTETFKNFH
ncbi:helix-turn-helix domain-containing protein [Bacillus salitolerans]|uniref:Helix-turn-helix domain-containing protein n=1 Tax=Bacillus salitolerans TaxID=1437434 RepID=A0ABW4LTA5_9BACI